MSLSIFLFYLFILLVFVSFKVFKVEFVIIGVLLLGNLYVFNNLCIFIFISFNNFWLFIMFCLFKKIMM